MEGKIMNVYSVSFINPETGTTSSIHVVERGIIPAIERAVIVFGKIGWDIVSATLLKRKR